MALSPFHFKETLSPRGRGQGEGEMPHRRCRGSIATAALPPHPPRFAGPLPLPEGRGRLGKLASHFHHPSVRPLTRTSPSGTGVKPFSLGL
jgi:hypothetical protein